MADLGMRSIAPIRDIIHDYMPFTPFEREVIDSPYFQRLHSVLQNSSAYVTYPSNRNTRFAHSLGVAFLAGRMFCSGLSHSTSSDLLLFVECVSNYLLANRHALHLTDDDCIRELERVWAVHVGNVSGFSHSPIVGARHSFSQSTTEPLADINMGGDKFSPLFIINTLFISLRLAGLFHDIGHLPTSHVFEHALDSLTQTPSATKMTDNERRDLTELVNELKGRSDKYRLFGDFQGVDTLTRLYGAEESSEIKSYIQNKQIHETRGLFIMDMYHSDTANRSSDHFINEYRKLLVRLAMLIIACPTHDKISKKAAFIPAVKQLIDSELDADRLDYTMRDPFVSGLEFGQVDVSRIVDNIVLASFDSGSGFMFCLHSKAVSNVEQLFHQRALGYQNLIYHRGNIRSQAVIESIIYLSYVFAYRNQDSDFCMRFAEFGFVDLKKNLSASASKISSIVPSDPLSMKLFDDSMFRAYLVHVIKSFKDYNESDSYNSKGILMKIKLLSEAFLFRSYRNIKTLFRDGAERECIFIDFGSDVERRILEALADFNDSADSQRSGAFAMFSSAKARVYKSSSRARHKDIAVYEKLANGYNIVSISDRSKYLSSQSSIFEGSRNFYIFILTGDNCGDNLINDLESRIRKIVATK